MLTGLASLLAAASCNYDPTATKLADLDVPKSVSSRLAGRRVATVAVTLRGDSGLDTARVIHWSGVSTETVVAVAL
jgi:hypothetical protein